MKKYIIGLFCLACSAEPIDFNPADAGSDAGSEDVSLGQNQSAIFIPYKFGLQDDTVGLKCDPSIAGGFGANNECDIPSTRNVKIFFAENSCSSWWKTRITNVLNAVQLLYNNTYGWNVQFVGPLAANFTVGCTTDPNLPNAFFDVTAETCQSVPAGQLCKYTAGLVGINVPKIEGTAIWANASSDQRRKRANNTVWHEVGGHMMGHGHYPGSQAGTKLMAQGFPNDLSSPAWNTDLSLDSSELSAVDCFNPGSSTSPLCP